MAEDVTIDDQIAEVEREIRLREVVYPRWSAGPKPKLSAAQAEKQIARMRAVLVTLRWAATVEALLRQFVTAEGVVNYDSQVCWGCGEPKDLPCEASCLLGRSRELLDIKKD